MMQTTWLDNNTWLWEIAGQRILVDPWLVGDLVFGGAGWLFRGERSPVDPLPADIDLILLSQGLEDHAHPDTLQVLAKSIPVVASPSGAKVAAGYGFEQVTALDHGEHHTLPGLTITAVPGAPIGPTLKENGYILTETASQLKLFYEPHGFHPEQIKTDSPIDVVITPMMDIALPLVGPIIRGQDSAQELATWLQPQVMLPTANAGEATYHGLLVSLLRATGGVEQVRQQLRDRGNAAQVLDPKVGEALALPLVPRRVSPEDVGSAA